MLQKKINSLKSCKILGLRITRGSQSLLIEKEGYKYVVSLYSHNFRFDGFMRSPHEWRKFPELFNSDELEKIYKFIEESNDMDFWEAQWGQEVPHLEIDIVESGYVPECGTCGMHITGKGTPKGYQFKNWETVTVYPVDQISVLIPSPTDEWGRIAVHVDLNMYKKHIHHRDVYEVANFLLPRTAA